MSHDVPRSRRPRFTALPAAAVLALALAVATGCGDDGEPVTAVDQAVAAEHGQGTASAQMHTEAAHAFHDDMRKLWEDHVTWTRLAIVSFVDDLSDLDATVARLLQNQADIGDAIKPFYGDEAGAQLTTLLEDHINGAVEIMAAAKAGDRMQVKRASAAWYRNGDRIADFLSGANPDNWPRAELRSMMSTHLDQTLDEAVQRLDGDHEAEIRTYDEIHVHILAMADTLSGGIVAQFPEKFE